MKHTIEIEGLPDGWEIEKCDIKGDISSNDASFKYINAVIRITKKQPRRIVLEETSEIREARLGDHYGYIEDRIYIGRWSDEKTSRHNYKIWRIVEDSGEKNDD